MPLFHSLSQFSFFHSPHKYGVTRVSTLLATHVALSLLQLIVLRHYLLVKHKKSNRSETNNLVLVVILPGLTGSGACRALCGRGHPQGGAGAGISEPPLCALAQGALLSPAAKTLQGAHHSTAAGHCLRLR